MFKVTKEWLSHAANECMAVRLKELHERKTDLDNQINKVGVELAKRAAGDPTSYYAIAEQSSSASTQSEEKK